MHPTLRLGFIPLASLLRVAFWRGAGQPPHELPREILGAPRHRLSRTAVRGGIDAVRPSTRCEDLVPYDRVRAQFQALGERERVNGWPRCATAEGLLAVCAVPRPMRNVDRVLIGSGATRPVGVLAHATRRRLHKPRARSSWDLLPERTARCVASWSAPATVRAWDIGLMTDPPLAEIFAAKGGGPRRLISPPRNKICLSGPRRQRCACCEPDLQLEGQAVLGGDVTGMQGKNGEAFLIDTLKCFVGKAGPHSLALPFVSSPQDCVQLTGTLVGGHVPASASSRRLLGTCREERRRAA